MLECFHSEGKTPVERDLLKMFVREEQVEDAVLRSMWLEIPSGPEVVLTLMKVKTMNTFARAIHATGLFPKVVTTVNQLTIDLSL